MAGIAVRFEIIPPRLKPLFRDSRVAIGAVILAALILLYGFVHSVMLFIPSAEEGLPQAGSPLEARLSDIAGLHLFGDYRAPFTDLPETSLQLKLEGVFSSSDPRQSWAIIGTAGGPSRPYRIDQEIPGGAKIYRILKNRVVLEHNGELETLLLPLPTLEFGPRPRGKP